MTNSLFSISSTQFSENTLEAKVTLADWHPLYEGHFPGAPVLPGVVQLEIVKEVLQQHFARKVNMKEMRTCKFLGMINPLSDSELTVLLKWQDGESPEVVASIQRDTVFMKAQITYVFEQ